MLRLNLACAYGHAGREHEARAVFTDATRLLSDFSIAQWKATAISDDLSYLAWRERCYDMLRQMGMPEE
jgi:hypothetical protein